MQKILNLGPEEYQRQQERQLLLGTKEPYYLERPAEPGDWRSNTRDAMNRAGDFNN